MELLACSLPFQCILIESPERTLGAQGSAGRRHIRDLTCRAPSPPAQDVVTRYASATGFHVTRRFGWDCHGLPVEYEIDKKLGVCRQSLCVVSILRPVLASNDAASSAICILCTLMRTACFIDLRPPRRAGIKSKDDVLAMGIDKYNEECRSIVMRYSKARSHTLPLRLGYVSAFTRAPLPQRPCQIVVIRFLAGVGDDRHPCRPLDRLRERLQDP